MATKKTLEVGRAVFRNNTPKFTQVHEELDQVKTTAVSIGSYTGSKCLSIDVMLSTYHKRSDRLVRTYGDVLTPYDNIEALTLLRDAVEQAIKDARQADRHATP